MTLSCPYCSGSSDLVFETGDVNRRIPGGQFIYYQCSQCSLIFQHPIPDNLWEYYQGSYYNIPANTEQLANAAQGRQHKIDLIQQIVPTGRILEIGSSYGDFAYLALQAGYQIDVIEMDAECCRFLESHLGIKATNTADVKSALDQSGLYDVIVLWHVIEHIPKVWTVLSTATEHLSSNGILVLSSPNPNAFQFQLFKHFWTHMDAPRHLYLLPASLIVNHLNKAKMTVITLSTDDPESDMHEDYGWKKSLMNLVGISLTPPSLDGKVSEVGQTFPPPLPYQIARWILRSLSTILTWLTHPWAQGKLRGSSYTLILQKQQRTP